MLMRVSKRRCCTSGWPESASGIRSLVKVRAASREDIYQGTRGCVRGLPRRKRQREDARGKEEPERVIEPIVYHA